MVDKALFKHDSDEWATPDDFFALLDREFQFTLDPCATAENAKTALYFTKAMNGLDPVMWRYQVVFVNPPYSQIKEWVHACYKAARKHTAVVVLLIPSRTDTRYWHDYIMKASEVRFVRGRLKFGGSKNSAPFPSAVVVFRPGHVGYPAMSAMERR